MTDVAQVVDLVSRALGPNSPPEQIESVAAAVLDELLRSPGDRPSVGQEGTGEVVTVAAAGPEDTGTLCAMVRTLADAGCRILELSQVARGGLMVVSIVSSTGPGTTVADVRARLDAAATPAGVRIAVHHQDVARALVDW